MKLKYLKNILALKKRAFKLCTKKSAAKVKKFPAAKCVGVLYKVAVTAGYSTSTVDRKCLFSTSLGRLATQEKNEGLS